MLNRIVGRFIILVALISFFGCAGVGAEKDMPSQEVSREMVGVEAELLSAYMQDQSLLTLVDARTVGEFEAGHVNGAINVPLGDFDEMREHLTIGLDEMVLVYCKSGTRAKRLANKLSAVGYKDVRVISSHQLKFIEGEIIFANLD
ncbi:rhodanese-like domain-containing protein [Microbulbifer sp. JMSA002]|uniref:rhodanese-like domain-containing protein n=1 Tax=Microbulbifer sp. JMSA002 TaxID=3243368 RepID=UPI0040395996